MIFVFGGIMKKNFSILTLFLAVFCFYNSGFAEDTTGIYAAAKGGISFENINTKGNAGGGTANSIFTIQDLFASSNHNLTDTVGAFGGALGYDFQNYPFRIEVEYLYRTQSSTNFSNGGASIFSVGPMSGLLATGTASFFHKDTIQTLLLNGYWDIVDYNGFVPYLGGGIGLAFHNIKDSANIIYNMAGSNTTYGTAFSKTRSVTSFAWMASAGVAYKITPNWTLDLGYRLISFGDTGTSSLGATQLNNGLFNTTEAASMKGNVALSNEVLCSVRYTF